MNILDNGTIRVSVSDDARQFELGFSGEPPIITGGRGLFDMMVGRGRRHEQAIDTDQQAGRVTIEDSALTVTYSGLMVDGVSVPVEVRLRLELDGDRIECRANLRNDSDLCVEEFWFPWIGSFESLSASPADDVLIRPEGFGRRIPNPRAHVASLHTGYMAPDQVRIIDCGYYPGGWMSMPWYGVYGVGKALSVFSLDESFQTTGLLVSRDTPTERLSMGIARYPFLKQGEWEGPRSVVRLHRDDWHSDAKFYREWADATWWDQAPRPRWIDEMHGWQRIIMKHQYGEVFYRYEDLVDCFEVGMQYGINTLLVFGWFAGGHDNGYPDYYVDDELGGEEAFREAIAEIQRRGGRVMLYANGHIMDMDTEYYQTTGRRIALKTSNGSAYQEQYKFSGDGSYLRTFGAKSFAGACQSTDEWRDKLLEIGRRMIDLGADSIFFDQMGGNTPYLCFDESHPHAGPAFAQGPGKVRNLSTMRRELVEPRPDLAFGTELVADCLVNHVDYVHTATYGMSPGPQVMPEVFLYTFPEILLSSREIRDERDHVRRLNWAFIHGWRFDVEVWRCRSDLSDAPNYGEYMHKLIALRERYPGLLMTGRFIDEDEFVNTNPNLRIKGFVSGDELAVIGWNDTAESQVLGPVVNDGRQFADGLTVDGAAAPGHVMPPQSVAVLIYRRGASE